MTKVKDLSAIEYSATSTYTKILPELENLKTVNIPNKEKLEKARDLIISALCTARAASEHSYVDKGKSEVGFSISQDYIVNVRISIYNCRTLDQIINRVNKSIENGKNYKGANK